MPDADTIAAYDRQADEYARRFESTTTDPALVRFIEHTATCGYVLDLGCGPAFAAAVMRDHGLAVDPVDASVEMVQLANRRFDIGARLATFDDISAEGVYDGIWANFSLLHVAATEFDRILAALHRALKPKGVLHIGMKTGTGSARDHLGRFYTYYPESDLVVRLQMAGFTVLERDTGEDRGLAGDLAPWVVMLSVVV